MLTKEQVEAIEQGVIERHRKLYSDDQLWAMLDEKQERMALLLKSIAKIVTMLSVNDDDYEMWHAEVERYAHEYTAHLMFLDCVTWHMDKRGLLDAAKWREGWRDFNHATNLERWSVN